MRYYDRLKANRHKNRLKNAARARLWYRKNKERAKKRIKIWAARNADKVTAYKLAWAKKNKKKLSARNKRNYRRLKKLKAAYRMRNRSRYSMLQQRRINRIRGASTLNQIASAEAKIIAMRSIAFRPCCYCDKVMPAIALTIDHILPISRGGAHSAENIDLACKRCNSSKHDSILFTEWIPPNRSMKIAS